MIVNIEGEVYETEEDKGVCISNGIGECANHFGMKTAVYETHIHPQRRYKYDTITFCPHAHCTHTETVNHVDPDAEYCPPRVPLFQLCAVKSTHPLATACIDSFNPNCRHWLTTRASVDPEQDQGELTNHRLHFETHKDGVITELVRLPMDVEPGLYILLTTIVECFSSDSHPTNLRLFKIKKP